LSASSFVVLRDGPAVPINALWLVWRLEERGCIFRVEDDQLFAGPRETLTDTDRSLIREWRDDVKAIVAYCEREYAQ